MDSMFVLMLGVQLVLMGVMLYMFRSQMKLQQGKSVIMGTELVREGERLERMKTVALTPPLNEKIRPRSLQEIEGQEKALELLRAAICTTNPQHVILYGPPGVGKTAAARLVLQEAIAGGRAPFSAEAPLVELDGTTARFDERGIADPLMGSVHDPIFQGAGMLGLAGIPQIKLGAVSKAHGGILFIDEIAELHPVQMNKLLKVLEDRRVFFDSNYYSPDDTRIPGTWHEIFQKGAPADFRLIGATSKGPESIPEALRSRCVEIYFEPLKKEHLGALVVRAAEQTGVLLEEGVADMIARHAENGRAAVNILQLALGLAEGKRERILCKEDAWRIIRAGGYAFQPERNSLAREARIGVVAGLAVCFNPAPQGLVLEVSARCVRVGNRSGHLNVTGIIEEEEHLQSGRRLRNKSLVKASVETVMTAMRPLAAWDPADYDVHVHFPNGVPVDGPSAGLAIALALFSAYTGRSIPAGLAATGEVGIDGTVHPVGGLEAKLKAAGEAGLERVLIAKNNLVPGFGEPEGEGEAEAKEQGQVRTEAVATLEEALQMVFPDLDRGQGLAL